MAIVPEHSSVLVQSLILGSTQIVISFAVLLAVQRNAMGLALAGLAVRTAASQRPGM